MSISVAKWTVRFSFCASRTTSLLLFTVITGHAGNFSSLSHFLSTAAFASGRTSTCAPKCSDLSNWIFFSARCDFLMEWIPNAFSWIHEIPSCMHVLSFAFLLDPVASLSVSSSLSIRLSCCTSKFVCVVLVTSKKYQRNWESFFFRHVELNTRFDVMTIDRPIIVAGFRVFCFVRWLRLFRTSLKVFSEIFTPYRLVSR